MGVPANSSVRRRIANLNRFAAYAKVGRTAETDYDYNELLGEVNRTEESVETARKQLDLPAERLKWAFFWFGESEGDESGESWIPLLNEHTRHLTDGNLKNAAKAFAALISDENRGNFINALGLETLMPSEEECMEIYTKALEPFYSSAEILDAFKGIPAYELIADKIIDETSEEIDILVAVSRNTDKYDPEENLASAQKLIKSAYPLLETLRLVTDGNFTYTAHAERTALALESNIINYDWYSTDYDKARTCLKLYQYTLNLLTRKEYLVQAEKNKKIWADRTMLLAADEPVYDYETLNDLLRRINKGHIDIDTLEALIMEASVYLGLHMQNIGFYDYGSRLISMHIASKLFAALKRCTPNEKGEKHYALTRWICAVRLSAFGSDTDTSYDLRDLIPELRKKAESMLDFGEELPEIARFEIELERECFRRCSTILDFKTYLQRYPKAEFAAEAREKLEALEEAERKYRHLNEIIRGKINIAETLDQLWEIQPECKTEETRECLDFRAWQLCYKRRDYKAYLQHIENPANEEEAKLRSYNLYQKCKHILKKHEGSFTGYGILAGMAAIVITLICCGYLNYILMICGLFLFYLSFDLFKSAKGIILCMLAAITMMLIGFLRVGNNDHEDNSGYTDSDDVSIESLYTPETQPAFYVDSTFMEHALQIAREQLKNNHYFKTPEDDE